jgi:hypothetical protein
MPPVGFPRSIFAYWNDGGKGIIEAALPIMKHYKRSGQRFGEFDREKPWFCQLWGVVAPGESGDQIGVAATMMNEPMVELLAYVQASMEGYPLLMTKSQFDREYELD